VQTAPSDENSQYGRRRKAIRETWLPELVALPATQVQWVVGRSTPRIASKMAREERKYPGTFMHLKVTVRTHPTQRTAGTTARPRLSHLWPRARDDTSTGHLWPRARQSRGAVQECYRCLPQKTLEFFLRVDEKYDAEWIMKMDDDVYLAPLRLPLAAEQWARIGAEYIGCMKSGEVHSSNPKDKWFEPAGKLIGEEYYMNAYGSIYVLRQEVVQRVLTSNAPILRTFANEGARPPSPLPARMHACAALRGRPPRCSSVAARSGHGRRLAMLRARLCIAGKHAVQCVRLCMASRLVHW
jgi:Galactosyltransferase